LPTLILLLLTTVQLFRSKPFENRAWIRAVFPGAYVMLALGHMEEACSLGFLGSEELLRILYLGILILDRRKSKPREVE
jgi:hypothetical protein